MDTISEVEIEDNGTFKYILIKLTSKGAASGESKIIVRGYSWAEYHGKCLNIMVSV